MFKKVIILFAFYFICQEAHMQEFPLQDSTYLIDQCIGRKRDLDNVFFLGKDKMAKTEMILRVELSLRQITMFSSGILVGYYSLFYENGELLADNRSLIESRLSFNDPEFRRFTIVVSKNNKGQYLMKFSSKTDINRLKQDVTLVLSKN